MFDVSETKLQSLISGGESETVEFKARLPPSDNVTASNLTAFANKQGGVLLVGVKDEGSVVGLSEEEAEKTKHRLERLTSSLFEFPTEIGIVDVKGKKVVYVSVDKAPSHLAPIMTSSGDIYTREGGINVKLSQSEEFDLLREHRPAPSPTQQECNIFVAMSFHEEEEPALVDYYRAMERAAQRTELPLELNRMDLVEGDYEISQKIMDEIDEADVIVADFTLTPANVYFELGYARGREKRIIQTARKSTVLEFDVRNWRTISYRNATELEEQLIPAFQAAYADVTGQS